MGFAFFDLVDLFLIERQHSYDASVPHGFGRIIDTAVGNASYFFERISADPEFIAAVEPELSSVVFALDNGGEVNKKVRRQLLSEGTVIGQTVKDGRVMLKFTLLPSTSPTSISRAHHEDQGTRSKAFFLKQMPAAIPSAVLQYRSSVIVEHPTLFSGKTICISDTDLDYSDKSLYVPYVD